MVTTTGRISPSSLEVCALKPLQNSMMLTPCWPRAGPTGGDGLALPAGICSLTTAWSFFIAGAPGARRARRAWAARTPARSPAGCRPRAPRRGPRSRDRGRRRSAPCHRARTRSGSALESLHLVVLELDRGRPPEDGHHDLHAAALGVHVLDHALEVDERPVDDAHLVAALEHRLGLRLLGAGLHVAQDLVDLVGRQRDRLVAGADEPRHLARRAHQVPGLVGQLHLN